MSVDIGYDPSYCTKVIELAEKGRSLTAFKATYHIPERLLLEWSENHREFRESIELARRFSTEEACSFVNGILDKLHAQLQADDKPEAQAPSVPPDYSEPNPDTNERPPSRHPTPAT